MDSFMPLPNFYLSTIHQLLSSLISFFLFLCFFRSFIVILSSSILVIMLIFAFSPFSHANGSLFNFIYFGWSIVGYEIDNVKTMLPSKAWNILSYISLDLYATFWVLHYIIIIFVSSRLERNRENEGRKCKWWIT